MVTEALEEVIMAAALGRSVALRVPQGWTRESWAAAVETAWKDHNRAEALRVLGHRGDVSDLRRAGYVR